MSNPNVRTLPSPLSLDDFDVGVTLGTGSFGRVRFCTHKVCSTLSLAIASDLHQYYNYRRQVPFGL
jgi:hypothetical protein